MAEFKIPRIRFTWKSDWTTATLYTKDDIVRYGGKSYVCLVGHTSSADFNTDLEYINTANEPDTPAPKWVLWFDGFEWKNNWTPNTLYDLGDYVRYNSIIYICTNSHISAADASLGLEVDAGKWTIYAASDNWLKDWAINYRYRNNDIVRYGGTLYRCNEGHTSAETLSAGLEADFSKWDVVFYANDWKTDWAPNTRYKLDDVVRYGGIVYKCTQHHTSSASYTAGIDPDILKWTILHNGIEYRFLWVPARRYRLNDIVKYGADLYICTSAHTSAASFETGKWTVWLPGLEYADAWDASTSYVKGDTVSYGGYQYTSNITNNIGNIPADDNVSWTLLVKNYNVQGEWSNTADYRTGDLVRRDGYLYVAVADSVGEETTNNVFWKLVNPGMHWKGVWQGNTVYVIGDVVTYYSTSYICLAKHTSTISPLAEAPNTNWTIYVRGDSRLTLQTQGDIQTYNNNAWESVAIGNHGDIFRVNGTSLSVPAWDAWGVIGKVYYVTTTGVDVEENGKTLSTPWRTVSYACSQVTGPATIFVKTGTYSESLPISVPAGVALVGDELRGTVIQPARTIDCVGYASDSASNRIVVNTTVGIQDNDPIQVVVPTIVTYATNTQIGTNKITLGYTFGMTTGMPITFSGTGFGGVNANTIYYVVDFDSATSTITISETLNGSIVVLSTATGTMGVIAGQFAGLTTGQTYYVIGSTITENSFQVAASSGSTIPVPLTTTSNQNAAIYGADSIKDMFYVRNGCGIRNMTLKGLLGGVGSANSYGTKRPTGGSYVSLDPGAGPNDTSVWITTKSPYVQNVTNFGQGCTGLKIDGSLHNGGNRSIVANDFTQIISDGIGAWCTGHDALTELVSVFAYYGHIGYLAEAGGRIRATNGNTSYGQYGCVAEGYDTTETPILGSVNNRNQHAQIAQAFIGEATNRILKLEYSNAGQAYSGATYGFAGSGIGAVAVADEIRDGGIFETRITGTDYTAGGSGYITAGNQAQAGNTQSITIASNDQHTFAEYYGMRLVVTSGTGVGQYGYIAYYDPIGKVATIAKESITPLISTATNGTSNTIVVGNTSTLAPNSPIVIVPNQQVTTAYNTLHTVATMTQAYIQGNILYVVTMGAGAVAVGMILTGVGVTAGTTIAANISGTGAGSAWLLSASSTAGSVGTPITITGTNNLVTLTSTSGMTIGEQIVFTGSTYGNIVASTVYYIINIVDNRVAISATYNGSIVSLSNATGLCTATAGGMLGGLLAGQVYYVLPDGFTSSNFKVSTIQGGSPATIATQTVGSSMTIHSIGWEHINPGTPAVSLLDSTSVYSIEAAVRFTPPTYSSVSATLPTAKDWVSVAFGNGKYVAISSEGSTATSVDGQIWANGGNLPAATWVSVAYSPTSSTFVAVSASAVSAKSSDAGVTWGVSTSLVAGHSAITYGNGKFLAVKSGSSSADTTIDGISWSPVTLLNGKTWSDVAYGTIGTWVVISGVSSNTVAYSVDDGVTWLETTLPASANWKSVAWGNGRFVAISTGSTTAAYSFDGVTWYASTLPVSSAWSTIRYGQGVFMVVGTGTNTALSSQDGVTWTSRTLSSSANWSATVFGNPLSNPGWVTVAATTTTVASYVKLGATAVGRAVVANNKITMIKMWEPGSGYTNSPTPTVLITDPNATTAATTVCRVGAGVLGNPTFINRGNGYRTSTTVVSVATGDGYADIYQPSKYLSVSGLASLPTPGAALTIAGNANQYRIVVINDLGGNKALFQVSPPLSIDIAPVHGTSISIRQKYSQCRITGHDFLLVGTGGVTDTNFPNVDVTTAVSYQQIVENNGGRVFQTSTDQDGNYKVGNLFAVEQASGIVTISADQLSLTGLQSLALGGFQLGTNQVTITQFSTDSYFTANSDQIVPTQKAIKTYIARNIAGGGANAQAGAIVAGTFGVGGPNRIYSSTQTQLFVRNSMNIKYSGGKGGINGTMLLKSFFGHGFKSGE